MKAALIINSKAKNANAKTISEVYSALNSAGLDMVEFNPSMDITMSQFAEAAVKDGFDLIIAAGGDGTISTVASKVVGSTSALGVLPIGTYNNFAKSLGIPLNLEEAVRVLVSGETQELDVADVNGELFINNSSIGLYPHIVMRREKIEERNGSRWRASLAALIKALWKFPYYHVKVKFDGRDIRQHSPLIFIGNGFYNYGGQDLGKRELPVNGKLSVYILKNARRADLLKLTVKAVFNKISSDAKFEKYFVNEVEIHLPKKFVYVAKDGEILKLESPLQYRIKPRALKVTLPKRNAQNSAPV